MPHQLALPWRDAAGVRALLQRLPDRGPWRAEGLEGETLELKETPDTTATPAHARKHAGERLRTELAETAMSFANAKGGTIVVGVRDRAEAEQLVIPGVDAGRWSPDEVTRIIHERTTPPLLVHAQAEQIRGRTVLLIHVAPGTAIHGTTSGVFKHRVGDRNVPLDDATMRSLRAARGHYDWSAESVAAGLDGVSPIALAAAAERLRRQGKPDMAQLAERDPRQFLIDTKLMDADGRLTRAAVLLYGSAECLARHIPNWGLILRTTPSPGAEGAVLMRRDDARQPLALLLDDLLDRLALLARVETIRAGAEQLELVDYPPDALRELVANAFAHRDWDADGVIEIVHSPEELTVSSPGSLLPDLDPNRLLRANAPRNRLLAREMARLRLAEQAGLGFDRVYRELARIGKPPPVVRDGPRFSVTLPGGAGDLTFARYVARQLPDELAGDVDVLLLLAYLRSHRTVNATAAAPLLQRTPDEVQPILERADRAGLIEPTRGTARRAQPSYRLAPAPAAALRTALRYRTETIDSDDGKLIRHLQRNGRITNADVRDYLDCDTYTARNRLTRLRRRGLIDFAPDSPRRGPEVVYVKTPKLDELPDAG